MTHSCARTQVSHHRRDTYPGPPAGAATHPSYEEIARLAYGYWEDRGHPHGSAQEDWYRAERELLSRRPNAESSYLL
jgi:hypothetical protein